MKFTRKTYRRAFRRSLDLEIKCFMDHLRACRGPEAWLLQSQHTSAIHHRAVREGKW